MPTDKLDLERRVALTSPDYLVRGYNFGAVLALVEKEAGPEAAARLRAPVGKRVLGFFNYPAADFIRVAYGAADVLEDSHGGVENALRALGSVSARALTETTVGKTLLNFVRGGDAEQMIKHVHTAYSMAVSFGERTFSMLDPHTARLQFKGDPMPVAFHEGILMAGLTAVGLEVTVRGTAHALDVSEYHLRWP